MTGSKVSVVVYSPANMNAIDGSSVWVQTVTLALAEIASIEVSLLLSHAIKSGRLVDPLVSHPGVTVHDPFSQGWKRGSAPLTVDEAASILTGELTPDVVVVRGSVAARRLAAEPGLHGKLWPYLTDVPQHVLDVDVSARELFGELMAASPVLLCQTEELRTFLERCHPEVEGKGWLLPPTLPAGVQSRRLDRPGKNNLRLCYSGKFARLWNTYEMCDIPARLAEKGIDARLTMVGDKINRDPDHPDYVARMRSRLEKAPGVDWVGGVSRERSIEMMAQAHVGLSWRSPALDDSLELSTKLLEYCAAGTPPLLNRTGMHERVFGSDYPLFVNSEQEVIERLTDLTGDPDLYSTALQSISDIAREYTLQNTAARLSSLVEKRFPHTRRDAEPDLAVDVAGDAPELVDTLSHSPELSVRHEPSPTGLDHATRVIARSAASDGLTAQVVYLPLGGDGGGDLTGDDTIVTRAESAKRHLVAAYDIDEERIVTIPDAVDVVDAQRAKIENARFHIAWFLSASTVADELERAADLVGRLRNKDPRLILFVADDDIDDHSGLMRSGLQTLLERAGPQGVVFEGRPSGLSGWLRKFGFVVSFEAEPDRRTAIAMASGAVPVVMRAADQKSWYAPPWSHASIPEMADHILRLAGDGREWSRFSDAARVEAAKLFGREAVAGHWLSLLHSLV